MIIYYHCNSDNALLLSFLLTCHPYIPFHFMNTCNINNLKNLIIHLSCFFWYISLFFLLPLPCEIIIELGLVVVGPGALKRMATGYSPEGHYCSHCYVYFFLLIS